MIHFEGDRRFARPVSELFPKLSDTSFLVSTLADAKVGESSADRTTWKLKPKLSFLTGSLDAAIETTERKPQERVAFKITTKAIGATATVTAQLAFQPTESGTDIHWTGELVEVTGLLKMVPKGLLQGTAEKVIEDTWQAVEAAINASGPASSASPAPPSPSATG
jgi:carbon monoxide dehydrogenase subunit G